MAIMQELPNNSTGPWQGIGFWDHATTCAGKKGEVEISAADKGILRELAGKVRALAERNSENEKVELWYQHNSLKGGRPMILADPENGWNEIIGYKDLVCEGELAKRWEVVLRKELFWGTALNDDRPIERSFYVGYTFGASGWGKSSPFFGGLDGGSYRWEACIHSESDLNELHFPKVTVDSETTSNTRELAEDVFRGILDVKLRAVWWWGFGMTYDLARLLGLEGMMMLFYDNPRLIKKTMQFLMEGNLQLLSNLESNKLLTPNNDSSYVGSGGIGYCRELRPVSNDEHPVKLSDMWGHSESQETSSVAPEMFEEFIFPYQLEIIKNFGLSCYGCCEPLDRRWHVVRRIPNLRRVSVSAWADQAKMADYLQNRYIYSFKPNPAQLAVPSVRADLIRAEMTSFLQKTKGCIVEVIMKDNHTLGRNPNNIVTWVQSTRKAVEQVYGG